MRTADFLAALPALFDEYPRSELPRDRSLQPVLDAVEGLSELNNMALLALAATNLEPDEVYLEAGSHKGRTLIATALGAPEARLHAIDKFAWESSSRAELEANIERFGVAGRIRLHEGDTAELLEGPALDGLRVGIFFYDADHSSEATAGALRAVRRHLADEALLVVDDADWDRVRAGEEAFLADEPRARHAERIEGRGFAAPWWWDGVDLLVWRAA
jgi:predicted O-methyltransferase YrrM